MKELSSCCMLSQFVVAFVLTTAAVEVSDAVTLNTDINLL